MSDAPLNLSKSLEEFLLEFEKHNLFSSKCGEFECLNNLIAKRKYIFKELDCFIFIVINFKQIY